MSKYFIVGLLFLVACSSVKEVQKTYNAGNYEQTIKEAQAVLASDSTNAEAYFMLGQAYSAIGKPDSARMAYQAAVRYKSDEPDYVDKLAQATILVGERQFAEKEYDAALSSFRAALGVDSTKTTAAEKIADVYVATGKHDDAMSAYQELKSSGDSLRIRQKIAELIKTDDQAREIYRQALQALEKYRYDAAKKNFGQALELKPDFKDARYQLRIASGLVLFKKGSVNDLWDAIEQFGLASTIKPDLGEPHYYMALAYNKKDRKEYENAIREFEKAVEVEPDGQYADISRNKAQELRAHRKKMKEFWGK